MYTCHTLIYTRYPGKLSSSPKQPMPPLSVPYLSKRQKKTGGSGEVVGGSQAKHRKSGYGCHADLSPGLLH